MKSMGKGMSVRELVLTGGSAFLSVICAGRIFQLLHAQGNVYTMGILPLAMLFGLYCLWKRALFLEGVFFPVTVRALLAAGFASLQVLGAVYSHPGICGVPEAVLWALCFTPITFAGQNMLFFLAGKAAGDGIERRQAAKSADAVGRVIERRGSFPAAFAAIFGGFCIPFATYYPAIMAYDVIPQLDQIRVSGLTTHHPLIHTLMLKGCLAVGELLSFLRIRTGQGWHCTPFCRWRWWRHVLRMSTVFFAGMACQNGSVMLLSCARRFFRLTGCWLSPSRRTPYMRRSP